MIGFKLSSVLLGLSAVALLVMAESEVPEFLPGFIIRSRTTRAEAKTTCDANVNSGRFDCDGCNQLVVCDRNRNIIGRVNCSDPSPHCNSGRCSSTPTDSCKQGDVSDLCPSSSGYFPHPSSCQKYIYCDGENKMTEYQCPTSYIYDQTSKLCKVRTAAVECPTINCQLNRGRFIAYTPAPELYVFCTAEGNPMMFQCPAGEAFDVQRKACWFACTKEGRFKHPTESETAKYVLCVKDEKKKLQAFEESCPNGLIFKETCGPAPEDANCGQGQCATA